MASGEIPSRCGDFRVALDLLAAAPDLCARLGSLITHRVSDVEEGFELARARSSIKVVVQPTVS